MISSVVVFALCRFMLRGSAAVRRTATPSAPAGRDTSTSDPVRADDTFTTNLAVMAVATSVLSNSDSSYTPSDISSGGSGGGSIDNTSF
jgi:hypothetical protein